MSEPITYKNRELADLAYRLDRKYGDGQIRAFTDADGPGYMERHKNWLSSDDHLFLVPEPLTIYTSLPDTPETADYYADCFPDAAVLLVFCESDQLALLAEGEDV